MPRQPGPDLAGVPQHVVQRGTDRRLTAALGARERFWSGLQADFDLEEAHRTFGKSINQIERIAA